jgi:hypothetical protein
VTESREAVRKEQMAEEMTPVITILLINKGVGTISTDLKYEIRHKCC